MLCGYVQKYQKLFDQIENITPWSYWLTIVSWWCKLMWYFPNLSSNDKSLTWWKFHTFSIFTAISIFKKQENNKKQEKKKKIIVQIFDIMIKTVLPIFRNYLFTEAILRIKEPICNQKIYPNQYTDQNLTFFLWKTFNTLTLKNFKQFKKFNN